MTSKSNRQRRYSPRSLQTIYALYLTGLLGFASVRQLCLLVWADERRTNDHLKSLLDHNFLQQAYEPANSTEGRSNRIVFLTREGIGYLLEQGHLREADVAFYWKGEGRPSPQYNPHSILIHDVLAAFIKQANEDPQKQRDLRLDPTTFPTADIVAHPTPLNQHALLPDRIFALKAGDQYVQCYLEVDRGTEDRQQWRQKLEKYLASSEIMQEPWVRVLTVAHTAERMHTLLRWSTDLATSRFLFSHIDAVCYQYERQGRELVLTTIGDPFGAIWKTVGCDERVLIVA